MKIFYTYYVADGVYHMYKFSIYGREKIKLVHAGLAYDNHGNYSKEFQKLKQKYSIKEYSSEQTSYTFKDFLNRIYISSKQTKITKDGYDLHSIIFDMLKWRWDDKQRNISKEIESFKEDLLKTAQPIQGKEQEFETQIVIMRSRFRDVF